ncbi:MAG: CSLREA domain-containing protein [Solirubrobacterales bacterium]
MVALVVPAAASAAEVTVTTTADEFGENPDPANCGLREAVEAANGTGAFGGCQTETVGGMPIDTDLDIIYLPDPNYALTVDGVEDLNAAGDLDVRNEGLSILGQNTAGPSTIDGNAADLDLVDDRVIEVHASAANGPTEDFGATGLTITFGRAPTGEGGGGIYINGPPAMGETFTVDLSLTTFTRNAATLGGAIENESGEDLGISDSTISNNTASGTGGGVDTNGLVADPATTTFENVTVTNNRADSDTDDSGSGGGVVARLSGGNLTSYNTIIGGNFDDSPTGTVAPDCFGDGTLTSGGYNLIGNTANCPISAGTGDLRDISPNLAGLALIPGAGLGTVRAHDLLSGSPARDAGNPAAPGGPLGTCGVLAQNFGPRPQGPACDIGSVEADFIPPVAGAIAPLTVAESPAVKKKCKKGFKLKTVKTKKGKKKKKCVKKRKRKK